MNKVFVNESGDLVGELPEACWRECSEPGRDAGPSVRYWREELGFTVPRERAITYLREFGAWPEVTDEYDKGLRDMSDTELADKVLWLASGDIRENGEWFGLHH